MTDSSRTKFSFQCFFLHWREARFRFEQERTESELTAIREAGASHVMTGGVNCACKYELDVRKAARSFRRRLDELGLEVSSHHCVLPTVAMPGDSEKAIIDNIEETVEICALLRPANLVLHPGNVLGRPDWGDGLDKALKEADAAYGHESLIAAAAKNIKRLAKAAAAFEIKIAVETMWEPLPLQGASDLPELLTAVDEPNAGYCVDSGHLHLRGESPGKWIRLAGPKLFETHFHDNCGLKDQHLPAGFGTIDWMDAIAALNEIDYQGPVAFETGGWPDCSGSEAFGKALDWWLQAEKIAKSFSTRKT